MSLEMQKIVAEKPTCRLRECENDVGDRVSQQCQWCQMFYCLSHVNLVSGLCDDCVPFANYANDWLERVSVRIREEEIDSRDQLHRSWHEMVMAIRYNGKRLGDMEYLDRVEEQFGTTASKAVKTLKAQHLVGKKRQEEQQAKDNEVAKRLLEF